MLVFSQLHIMLLRYFAVLAILCDLTSCSYRIDLKKHLNLGSVLYSDFKSNLDYYKDGLESYLKGLASVKFDKNVEYSGKIGLGRPKQNFVVFFDTSFSGLWVISNECNWRYYYTCYMRSNKYNKEKSKTYKSDQVLNRTDAQYDGHELEIAGVYTLDTLWLDSSNEVNDQQFLGVTTFCTDSMLCMIDASLIPDGVFGLGFPSNEVMMGPPVLTTMDRGQIANPIFSWYIDRRIEEGELIVGDDDKDIYEEDSMFFVDVNTNEENWMIDLRLILGPTELCNEKCTVLVDTGTALIAAPLDRIKLINRILGIVSQDSEDVAKISCDKIASLPDLSFFIKDKEYKMTSEDYVIKLKDGCILGFMENRNSPNWILGSLFLQNVYTVFNYGARQIAEAEPKLFELARLVGVNIEKSTIRLLILLLEEGYTPESVYAMFNESIK